MTVFRLKQLASSSAQAAAGAIGWNYDRAELIADGIVHGIGVFGGLIIFFLIVEPEGLNRLWRNIRSYFRVWPFSY